MALDRRRKQHNPEDQPGPAKSSFSQRYTPAFVAVNILASIIFFIIINLGSLNTIPTSGFTHYYTNYHVLEVGLKHIE
jgi:hypothetical protein